MSKSIEAFEYKYGKRENPTVLSAREWDLCWAAWQTCELTLSIQQEADAKDAARWRGILDLICTSDGSALLDALMTTGFAGDYPSTEEMTAAIDTAMATPTDSEAKTSA
jgi:hypothetical protein